MGGAGAWVGVQGAGLQGAGVREGTEAPLGGLRPREEEEVVMQHMG